MWHIKLDDLRLVPGSNGVASASAFSKPSEQGPLAHHPCMSAVWCSSCTGIFPAEPPIVQRATVLYRPLFGNDSRIGSSYCAKDTCSPQQQQTMTDMVCALPDLPWPETSQLMRTCCNTQAGTHEHALSDCCLWCSLRPLLGGS